MSDAFWDFALAVYGLPRVQETCLALQDELGLDVMVLLCCLWCGACRGRLSQPSVAAMVEATSDWQASVTERLRNARRWLKTHSPEPLQDHSGELRRAIQETELKAEQLAARLLVDSLQGLPAPQPPKGREAALANARRYALLRGLPATPRLEAQLKLLADAAARLSP